MALAESIFAKLSAAAAVTALIGAGSASRLYPGVAPAGAALPYVVYSEVASVPDVTHDGPSTSGLRLVQLSCVAATYLGARSLAAKLIAAIDSVALAGGELCLSCKEQDGFSEATDQFLRIVEADFFAAPAT